MTIISPDGTDVVVTEEGQGAPILVIHGGMSDEAPWAKVAAELASDYHVVRIRRRLYRLELPADPATDVALEVADVAAVAATFGQPCLVVGHSSGAIIALESLVAHPAAFAGAVLYEPPVVLDGPLGTRTTLARARAAIDAGRVGKAVRIFLAEAVQLPTALAVLIGVMTRFTKQLKTFGPRQIDDLEAIDRLGRRLEAYGAIQVPVLFVSGDTSPAHLTQRTEAVAAAMPHARITTMPGQGHGANDKDPALVARLIAGQAREVGLSSR
ncbi:MAG: alpha/beta fold hydrolase [Propionibacteriaceae bacterium]